MAGPPLSGPAAHLAATTTDWSDQWWDAEVGLIWIPPDPVRGEDGGLSTPEPTVHLLPQTAWYAVGLLLRDGPGDRERAAQALTAVLDHQYDAPGEVWHGTYALFHEAPEPQPGATMWVDYDPNWRQFIGCTLLLVLRHLADRIPADMPARIEAALRLTVEGEPEGRIPDSYANIALMHAYLEAEAGHLLGEQAWIDRGEDRARRVVARYDEHGAYDEYNSPTYYGIDLKALGLWRGHSSSALLAAEGARLEAALWRDSVRWYHAALRNVAGPYTRAYGMDLGAYVAAWSIWVWAAAGLEHAPLPPLDEPLEHGMDFTLGALVALIGAEVPEDALAHLKAFAGERSVQQRISGPDEGDRTAAAWLGADAMIGAESSTVDLSWWDQFHGATVHWRRPDGSVGWLRATVPGPSDATVEPGRLTLRWHHEQAPDEGTVARFRFDPGAPTPPAGELTITSDGPTPTAAEGSRTVKAAAGRGAVTTFVIEVPTQP